MGVLMRNGVSYTGVGIGEASGGGHTIENSAGTALTQRDTLQFKGGLSVSDDSTNEVTVVSDIYPEIEYSVWDAMTPQEQEAIPDAIITNVPDTPDVPDGSTVTPTDDVQTLLACAEITDKSYTTLNELLADTTTLQRVIISENAIDYLVRSTTWASGMCANQTAMSYIGLTNYASNTLLTDTDWLNAICNSTYFESVLNVKVPTMTSATTPSGVASNGGDCEAYSGQEGWKAFDGNISTAFYVSIYQGLTTNKTCWTQYQFVNQINAKLVKLTARGDIPQHLTSISASNDGSTFTTLTNQEYDWSGNGGASSYPILSVPISANDKYSTYRITLRGTINPSDNNPMINLHEAQIYGREDV